MANPFNSILGTLQNPIVTAITSLLNGGLQPPALGSGGFSFNVQNPVNYALNNSQYNVNILKYPMEVGSVDVPSYINFNIYVPTVSQYATNSSPSGSSVQSASQQNSDTLNAILPQQPVGKISAAAAATGGAAFGAVSAGVGTEGGLLERGGAAVGGAVSGALGATAVSALGQDVVNLKPQLSQISTSIQLYMPDTVMESYNHDWSAESATQAMGRYGLMTAAGGSLIEAFDQVKDRLEGATFADLKSGALFKDVGAILNKDLVQSAAGREVLGGVAEQSGIVGPNFTAFALRSAGLAINPRVELLYKGTQNRSFVFEFRFQPRSQQEAAQIQSIIQAFKLYSSPGISDQGNGRYFIVPGQFDIQFYFGNSPNPYIGKISTCALTGIDVNYAGAGQWATFQDGFPVEIQLQLRFTEAEVLYQQHIAAGY